MVHGVDQLLHLSLTSLELVVSLVQLGLQVLHIALCGGQLVLSVLQPCTSGVKEVGLDIAAAISPHQLIVQLLVAHLQAAVLLKELAVALSDALDEAVLLLHLVVVRLQAHTLVLTNGSDLPEQGTHVTGVACGERPPRVVGRVRGVASGGQTLTPRRVALIPYGK